MQIADFEIKLSELISQAMKDESNETIRRCVEYQLGKMDEYRTREAYMEAMKLGDEE